MKKLHLDGLLIHIESPDKILNWDSTFQKDLYEFCYAQILDSGNYEPYIDVDRFNQDYQGSAPAYQFDLDKKISEYNIKLKNDETPSRDCDCPDLFSNQLILRSRLLKRFPVLTGLFKNISVKSEVKINNLKQIMSVDKINLNNISQALTLDYKLYCNNWTRALKLSERQSGNSVVGKITEEIFKDLFSESFTDNQLFKVNNPKVSSYGDYVCMCLPNNLWISVKSKTVRERLLASGYCTDIIGIGRFQDFNEFTDILVSNLKKVGFLAVYLPDFPVTSEQSIKRTSTYQQFLENREGKELPLNFNGKSFIRKTSNLINDLNSLLQVSDMEKRTTIDF